ncbi:glycosyltransferase family 4 protein (plasmid) [Bradyrhizobium sp. ISRA436]|uniref:glycosyltransferase family 4 protein n=1 Tax=unclassified Bradyrhizobium TaxID=2631580 RepID=UPI00247A9035|nr:glycosyltransferase family 4 protein [Bradyrhizobium sp. ISRA436]WGS03088.1 glycosyltransferase family 4 protein [Bradyrhizobium sp. ISRA436]
MVPSGFGQSPKRRGGCRVSDCRILALVTDAFGGLGGIAQYNRDFLTAVAADGVSVFALHRQALAAVETPLSIQQTQANSGRLRYSIAVLRAALRQRPDVVFCGHIHLAPLGYAVARLAKARFIVQTHGIEVWSRPSPMRRLSVERADLVLCVSRHTRASVLNWAALPPERVLVVPNTVRDVFRPGDGGRFREKYGLHGKQILLSAGRIAATERYKGREQVMSSLGALAAQGQDPVYVVIGDGDDRNWLENRAIELGVADRTRFLGAVEVQTLAEAYQAADVLVMPSTGEGFGIVFIEATASGTPALGFGIGGAVDALAEGELGVVAEQGGLAAAILAALAARRDADGLARATRARFGREVFDARVRGLMSRIMSDRVAYT